MDVKEASEEFDEESRVDLMAVDTDDQIEDIDAVDRNDPICCTEYVNEIFAYCRKREVCLRGATTFYQRSFAPL